MTEGTYDLLLSIIEKLREARIFFSLSVHREDSITILCKLPGKKVEIDVYADGEVDVEVYCSGGEIHDLNYLREIIRDYAEN